MVVAIKEHVLIGIMQQSLKCRYRLAFNAQQARDSFICACFDQPNRRIRDPYVRCCGRGAQRWASLSPLTAKTFMEDAYQEMP